MQEAIDQIMRTYGMMFNLSPSEEQSARERVTDFSERQGRQHPQAHARRREISARR